MIDNGRADRLLKPACVRTIERPAHAEAVRHLTQALKLLQSRPEGPARRRAALGLKVLLSQAMIAVFEKNRNSKRRRAQRP